MNNINYKIRLSVEKGYYFDDINKKKLYQSFNSCDGTGFNVGLKIIKYWKINKNKHKRYLMENVMKELMEKIWNQKKIFIEKLKDI